jgi:hypothetical protein
MIAEDNTKRYFSETLERIQKQADALAYNHAHRRAHTNRSFVSAVTDRINIFTEHQLPEAKIHGRTTLAELPASMY